ncbi:glycosyltransferase [Staphylothermus hellenicus]|uniref:Glycosyl transferase family 2 n=1 Tax=Staphylothermus hellenicus (strain DSM 12710 / JCM 10830 / BK20S6-10-b1 / P8) TaxID=591019 RepID=D7D892_STAHD|nr:glycosyltransferase [Staphylothermus hellenicus]ADI31988.1 glycosyl transferase family 2 [Staphylothermus hellenicus DSM 12710]
MTNIIPSLEIIALILTLIHFGIPLAYYVYLKKKWLPKPWNLKINPKYTPRITVIVPTYNEAKLIIEKLNNIYMQDYPKDKLEVLVVDSASTDGTPRLVEDWARKHTNFRVMLVKEPSRRGMAHALWTGFKHAKGDIIIVTDADAIWTKHDILREIVKWLSCEDVGAISCIKEPLGGESLEYKYRQYYNILRIAESKAWSTPIFHGELSAFKKKLLKRIGGFPLGVGSAESLAAMKIAALGYRAIISDNVVVQEIIPRREYTKWRIRRAQHLIIHLIKTLSYIRNYNNMLKVIVLVEAYLHIINPWILLLCTIVLLYCTLILHSILAGSLIILGLALLAQRAYHAWIISQLFLLLAQIKNLWNKELVWKKQEKV